MALQSILPPSSWLIPKSVVPGALNQRHPFLSLSGASRLGVKSFAHTEALLVLDEEAKQYYKEVNDAGNQDLNAAAPGDFYELLGLEMDASAEEIKSAYRSLQRLVHPDIAGDEAHDVSILLNIAYKTLTSEESKMLYDSELRKYRSDVGSFDGKPFSKWLGSAGEQRAVFVDETTCIGCRNCTMCAPNTFFMEDEYGRARVSHQWGDEADAIVEAMDMCPVDCIYFVKKKQLALLEFVMKFCKRESVAILARRRSGNMGPPPASENPFTKAEVFLKNRKEAKVSEESEHRQVASVQDEILAAAVAKAWLSLSPELRAKGWPSWQKSTCTI